MARPRHRPIDRSGAGATPPGWRGDRSAPRAPPGPHVVAPPPHRRPRRRPRVRAVRDPAGQRAADQRGRGGRARAAGRPGLGEPARPAALLRDLLAAVRRRVRAAVRGGAGPHRAAAAGAGAAAAGAARDRAGAPALVWGGDILTVYAVVGLVVLLPST